MAMDTFLAKLTAGSQAATEVDIICTFFAGRCSTKDKQRLTLGDTCCADGLKGTDDGEINAA
jgi:hypothetical protein